MKYAIIALLLITYIFIGVQPVYCQATDAPVSQAAAAELRGLLPASPDEVAAPAVAPTVLSPTTTAPAQSATAPVARSISNGVEISVERDYIPIDHMRGLVVKVNNQSAHPVLVNCDNARVIMTVPRSSASLRDLEIVESPPRGFIAVLKADTIDTVVAGLTVGAAPAIKDMLIQYGPILKRYGQDEQRRQNEVQRFGKRLLWPGETSSGTIFFKTDEPLSGFILQVPLNHPFKDNSGNLLPQQYISTKIQQ